MRGLYVLAIFLVGALAVGACSPAVPVPSPQAQTSSCPSSKARAINLTNFNPVESPDEVAPLEEQHYFGIQLDEVATLCAPFDGYIQFPPEPVVVGGRKYVVFGLFALQGRTRLVLYLGQQGRDVVLSITDGQRVKAGDPLAKIINPGPTFASYLADTGEGYQIVGYWMDAAGKYLKLDALMLWKFLG